MGIIDFFAKRRSASHTARIEPAGRNISVTRGTTLLQAALDAGIRFPHNCRVGSCTSCRCRLLDGRVKELSETGYVLTAEEQNEGTILACQSLLLTDVKVELPPERAEWLKGKISRVRKLTHDLLCITIQLPKPMIYKAGQSAEISVGKLPRPRSYSFAESPNDNGNRAVMFHIRRVPGGEFTSWLFAKDRTGAHVRLRGPFGSFQMSDSSSPVICVAGGSGMAPIKAMLEDLKKRGRNRPVLFFYGARTRRDLYCLKEMKALERSWAGFTFIPVLSEEPMETAWNGARGMVTDELERTPLSNYREAYLCGPPPMIDNAAGVLKEAGFRPHEIKFDKFLDSRDLDPGVPLAGQKTAGKL